MARKRRIDPLALMYAMSNVFNTIDSMSQRRQQLDRSEGSNALKMMQEGGGEYPIEVIKTALQKGRAMPPDPNFVQKLFGKQAPNVQDYLPALGAKPTTEGRMAIPSANQLSIAKALTQKQAESDIALEQYKNQKSYDWLNDLTKPKEAHWVNVPGVEGTEVRAYPKTGGESFFRDIIPQVKPKKITKEENMENLREEVLSAMEKSDRDFPLKADEAKQVLGPNLFRKANANGLISQHQSGVYNWASAQKEPTPFYMMTPTDTGLVKTNARTGTTEPTQYDKPIGEETKQAMSFIGQIKDSFSTFKNAVDKYGWHGPVLGAYGETAGRLLPTTKGYEEIRPLAANLMDIVYPKSGKQINVTELSTLHKYVPQMTDKVETVKEKMANFERHLNSIEENYKTLKTRTPTEQPKTQQPAPTVEPDWILDPKTNKLVPNPKKKVQR